MNNETTVRVEMGDAGSDTLFRVSIEKGDQKVKIDIGPILTKAQNVARKIGETIFNNTLNENVNIILWGEGASEPWIELQR